VSRSRIAALASASTLASVVASELHGVAFGIMAGCAALVAGMVVWFSSTRHQKNGHHAHVISTSSSSIPLLMVIKKILLTQDISGYLNMAPSDVIWLISQV